MKWQIKHSRYLVDDQWLKLRADQCQMPNGKIIEPYYVLEYPDWINVFGITTQEEVVLVRQYRHGIGKVVVELPSGAIEASDANPMEAAKRELLEETGYTSDHFTQTGVVSPNTANHSNLTYCFLAKDLEKVGEPKMDETEEVETVLIPLAKSIEMLHHGDFLSSPARQFDLFCFKGNEKCLIYLLFANFYLRLPKEVMNMDATIDRFGRILIPQKLRKIFGLKPGVVLKIEGSEKEIRLKPLEDKPSLARKDGVLVFSADPTDDLVGLIDKVRSERNRNLINPQEK